MSHILHDKRKFIASFLDIKNLNATIYFLKKYIYIIFYLPRTSNNLKPVLVKIKKKVFLVEKLKRKMLVSNKIFIFKGFLQDFSNKEITISSYHTKIKTSKKP